MLLAMPGSYFAAYEFADMLNKSGRKTSPILAGLSVLVSVLAGVSVYFWRISHFGLVFILILLFLMPFLCWGLLLFSKNQGEYLEKVFYTSNVFFILIVPFLTLIILYFTAGRLLFLFLILGTKIGDIGAYVVGSLTNKISKGKNHKLIPSISPGKSWEGFFGGWIITVLFTFLVFPSVYSERPPFFLLILILFGSILFLFGAAGDLAESSLKRICGVKDSGNIIPGIGGVLDLVDSLMLNTPLFAVFLIVLKLL